MRKHQQLLAAKAALFCLSLHAANAQPAPPDLKSDVQAEVIDLQLEVFINDEPTQLIASLRREEDGTLSMPSEQLRNVGLIPAEAAAGPDGRVVIDRLPNVTYMYDEASQTIRFTASDKERVTRILNARQQTEVSQPQRGTGGVVNYTLFGNLQSDRFDTLPIYQGLSGSVDARLFSSLGTLSQSAIGRLGRDGDLPAYTRLDTRWSYSDPDTLVTYQAGDVISGGVSWSRPVRLGGLQASRNFTLRSDLVTMPIPVLSGSAAVPSTVDVFLNHQPAYSDRVIGGPFQVDNLPIVSGPGTARVVVRDALGRETVTDLAFYAAPDLLAPGLTDFSAEAGYARTYFGVKSDSYDNRLMGSLSGRYGFTDWLTFEGHAEGGGQLANGGVGAVFGLGRYGVGSLSLAGSQYGSDIGLQVGGSVQLEYEGWVLYARSQRTFGDYQDIASVTSWDKSLTRYTKSELPFLSVLPPRSLDQLSLSVPLKFDPSSINVNFTRLKQADGTTSSVLGISYSRQLGQNTGFISAYKDFENAGSYGIFAGISIPLGQNHSASVGIQSAHSGATLTADAMRPQGSAIGDYGWRVRAAEGASTEHSAAVSYRTPVARVEAGAQQIGQGAQFNAQAEGAVSFMDGEVFFSNRIDDAFAVVDAGAPNVEVTHENRPIGKTGSSGKILVPSLRSWEKNEIAIDPTEMPLDARIPRTRDKVVPADHGGVTVKFGVTQGEDSALLTLRDASGEFIDVGSIAQAEDGGEPFIVGYDGQAYIHDLKSSNSLLIQLRGGSTCKAEFSFTPRPGEPVSIADVVCR